MQTLRAIALALTALGLALPAWAEGLPASQEDAWDGDRARVRATLLLDLEPDRSRGSVGVLFELDPDWHMYWRHPGDSGLATQVDFAVTGARAQVGEIAWPAPREFREEEDLLTWGYADRVLLAAPIHWPEGAPRGSVRADVAVLVCRDQCIPGTLALERAVAPAPPAERAALRQLFERSALQVPAAAGERGLVARATAPSPGHALALQLRGCPGQDACPDDPLASGTPRFFPYAPEPPALRTTRIAREADGLRIELGAEDDAALEEPEAQLRGVLVLEDGATRRAWELALPLAEMRAAARPAAPVAFAWAALLRALAFGFAGGLLLNLMPCVLPVLAIKVFAIAEQAGATRRTRLLHAGAYTAGILLSLLALAAGVIALRWSGTAVGWGFHLQEPGFVLAVTLVLVGFALNLLGVFEIPAGGGRLAGLGAGASGARRSFWDGLLAVVLATPCSAPFLGTATGFAFASPAPVILAIFASIGLGLAAPFVAVAWAPAGARFLPRSGPWLQELRRGLGFALLGSAVWLAWIFGRTSGVDALAGLLALAVVLAFGAWLFGLAQRAGRRTPLGLAVGCAALLFAAGAGLIGLEPTAAPPSDPAAQVRAFSPEALAESRAAGRPAFVYFTADWCLTCKLNERRVLSDPRARAALASHGIDVFRADWTRRDETIRAELAKLGRAGVPVYALYPAGGAGPPRLLSELLQLEDFLAAVARAARPDAPDERAARR
jgi:thiol:disulfide interchange protein DsbD